MDWKIGDVRVQLVREIGAEVAVPDMYPGVTGGDVLQANASWLKPHFITDSGLLTLSIHMLVVRSMGQVIVVDCCVGEHTVPNHEPLDSLKGDVLGGLADIGLQPEDVDVVLCTHLHFDHVGWNTRRDGGRWVPTFPNARYLFARVEYEHWAAGAPGYALTFGDAVQPVVDAGQADLVDTDHTINAEIRLVPSPGHSPGHVHVQIDSGGESAVITGDLIHHPVQFVAIDWAHSADWDAPTAQATHAAFRERYADSGARIFGTHFGGPGSGFLVREGSSYRFDV